MDPPGRLHGLSAAEVGLVGDSANEVDGALGRPIGELKAKSDRELASDINEGGLVGEDIVGGASLERGFGLEMAGEKELPGVSAGRALNAEELEE